MKLLLTVQYLFVSGFPQQNMPPPGSMGYRGKHENMMGNQMQGSFPMQNSQFQQGIASLSFCLYKNIFLSVSTLANFLKTKIKDVPN